MSDFFGTKQELLGGILREFRKENGYTQQQIADYLGVDRTTYVKYETAQRNPDLDDIIGLAALYGISVDMLLGDYFDEAVNKKSLEAYAKASSPSGTDDGSKLTRDELALLAFFRKSIRKKEILDYIRRISSEDSKMSD